MFRYERVNSRGKFTIIAEIVSLLKKIYKRDAPFKAVFKVKTLAVLFPPYPREMKTNTAKLKSAASLSLAFFYGNSATHSHARSINLVPRAHVPFGQHQDTELWNNQPARSQSLRGFCF